jgi:hypothetical protein
MNKNQIAKNNVYLVTLKCHYPSKEYKIEIIFLIKTTFILTLIYLFNSFNEIFHIF